MAHPAQYYLSLFHNILDDDIGLFIIDTLLKTVLRKSASKSSEQLHTTRTILLP